MKKLVLKTAFVTLGVTLILAIAVFGITSFCAPRVMMNFTASLGLTGISGDYAYQEYERSGDMECLARSFEIAAKNGELRAADERFRLLYGDEAFGEYCAAKEDPAITDDGVTLSSTSYRAYLCSRAVSVRYRLAKSGEEKRQALDFALGETPTEFPDVNPVVSLAVEALRAEDGAFCGELLVAVRAGAFDENARYTNIVILLEEAIDE